MKYVRITRRIFEMLSLRMREAIIMVLLLGLYAVLEGFGIGLLLPVLQYLETGGRTLPTGTVWTYLRALSGFLHVPLGLGTLLALAFLPILMRQGVFYLLTWYNAIVQYRAVERLMVRTFGSVVHADIAFIESHEQGKLLSFITAQVIQCGTALITYIRLLSTIAIIVVYALLLAFLSWQLAAMAVVAMAVVSFAVRKILVGSREQGAAMTHASVSMASAVTERLSALRLVKMRAREDAEIGHIGGLAEAFRRAGVKIALAAAGIEIIVDPALMLAVFVIIYVGVGAFAMTLASLGLFLFILLRLNTKAKEVNLGRQTLASLMPSFDYVESTLAEADAALTPEGGKREFAGLLGRIEFHDVLFKYERGESEVLKGVSLAIPRGSMTAIVGRSGAGKSTLVDMIPLLRRPSDGRIAFDGTPAEEFDIASLRTHIGFLTQEPILFNGTIYNNLVYGLDATPTDAEIRAALDASYCTEFVASLPRGLETKLGDRGVRFSGGQRQRLALARVLLQSPDILILDEPTSALDSESEQYIQKAFESIAVDRTVVVIAHRLATVERADQIVVLQDGMIAEIGTHSELLAKEGGHYRRLFDMQIHA